MIEPLDLQSERFAATGNVPSEGVLNQLGRPRQDVLTLLVRESAQNSWDARRPDAQSVTYGIRLWTLTVEQLDVLRKLVLARGPGGGLHGSLYPGGQPLVGSDAEGATRPVEALMVYDRGTVGLGGPTRADSISEPDQPRNFVNLLRNAGQPPDRLLSGGTYGYGKGALFLASDVHTICVHTRCRRPYGVESRFIAAALGVPYTIEDEGSQQGLYTGRHWWGRMRNAVVEPLLDNEADTAAGLLGMRQFEGDELGTSILILKPRLGQRTPEEAVRFMALSFLWNFWPKLVAASTSDVTMRPELACESEPVPVPDPRHFPPLQGFVEALEGLTLGSESRDPNGQIISIDSLRPIQHLGKLSLRKFQVRERIEPDVGEDDVSPLDRFSHHVALLRQPRLVVRYLPGPALASDMIEYAGVFLADREVDHAFAASEPPTHDDWSYQMLEDAREKSFVRVALRRIDEALREYTDRPSSSGAGTATYSLAGFADQLGSLIPGAVGTGPSRGGDSEGGDGNGRRARGGGGLRRARATVVPRDDGELLSVAGGRALLIQFDVRHATGSSATIVDIEPRAVLDNNRLESEPPDGAEVPRVLSYEGPGKLLQSDPCQVRIPADAEGPMRIIVRVPEDITTGVELTAHAVFD
jgi:hypothetical protein